MAIGFYHNALLAGKVGDGTHDSTSASGHYMTASNGGVVNFYSTMNTER